MSLIKNLNNKGPSIDPWDKFQAIAVGNKTHAKTPVFKIDSAEITCDEVVKLLGIDIDYQLNFNYHIKNICRRPSIDPWGTPFCISAQLLRSPWSLICCLRPV
jgi:hypothetical protein